MQSVNFDDFSDVILSEISEFTDETCLEIENQLVDSAGLAERLLQADNDRSEANKHPSRRSGEYAKSWTLDKTGSFAKGESARKYKVFGSGNVAVYNKKHYRLSHIFEKGATLENGGIIRGDGHITKVWEKVKQDLKSKGLY